MEQFEEKSRKRKRNQDLKRILLGTVAAAGVISVSLIAPGVVIALEKLNFVPPKRQRDSVRQSQMRLIQQGLLIYANGFVSLTPKGAAALEVLNNRKVDPPKPRRWDRRWRVLVFDIPERKRAVRDKIRNTLTEIGFVRMQDSVWLYPYDCEDMIVLLKADLKIGKDVIYMIVDSMEADRKWRKHFGLPEA